ncbi:DUF6922 domain-containing protein [Desulfatirhabdium butyrativorans]|uniref:DUF6922 domain-containing protein n=1 Tax=Desulfatirhabdium butyrativorans TaxID=340467 RepID=UPI00042572CE|nr:hypothetical protein [Desulfatirhabdium butyrativorans]
MSSIESILSSRRLFWDKAILDPETDRWVIAERVLERGTAAEVDALLAFYGKDWIGQVIRESRNLSPKTVNYFCFLLGIPRKETRCFSDASPRIWQPF